MQLTELHYIQDFLRRHIGLSINDNKAYLIKSRTRTLLAEYGLDCVNELARMIRRDEKGELARQFLEAMTTNETRFFRDQYPFDALSEHVLPELRRERGSGAYIRLWSAATSTGQEAYSMAMCASEVMPNQIRILGTDYSRRAIEQAQKGVYSQMQVQRGLPVQKLVRFFEQRGDGWSVHPDLMRMTHFEQANLVSDALVRQVARHGPFDVVFCRNVLIYFSPDERRRVIDRIARCMPTGGYLITGATETPVGDTSQWQQVVFKGKRLWRLMPN